MIMQMVFHNLDRETLKKKKKKYLNLITLSKVVGQVAVQLHAKHRRIIYLREWCSCPDCMYHVNPWTCPFTDDTVVKVIHACSVEMSNSQWCSSLWNYIPVFRKGSKFIHWLFLMSFTCTPSISVADQLILEISCPDFQGSPA